MISFFDIYWTFFKINSVTFGGGMAMLPILQREIVQGKEWVSDEEIIDFYALCQGLPGILAVNVSALIGYRRKGILGVIAAGLGVISPSIIIITIITSFLSNFQEIEAVQHAFKGISVGVTALILNTVLDMWKKSIVDKLCIITFIITFILMITTKISPVVFVIIGAIVGIIVKERSVRN